MKALLAIAIVMTSSTAFAAAEAQTEAASARERKVCTRIERRSQSRVPARRICLTPSEWRDRLGPDWRQNLAGGNSAEDDLEAIGPMLRENRDVSNPMGSGPGN